MLNKKRQELIIQNLKSISSQVRLMSVEQLVNLPSMPASEKIKLLQACLNDSEEAVQNAAKAAVNKLSGNQSNSGSAPTQSPGSPQIPSPSSGMEMGLPSLSALDNSSDSNSNNSLDSGKPQMGFGLPSLGDLNSNPPAPQNNMQTPLPNSSQNINRPNMPFPPKVGTNNFGLPNVNSALNPSVTQASAPIQTQAPLPPKIPASTSTPNQSPF